MQELESKHGSNCLFGESGDAGPVLGCDHVFVYHPGTAACDDLLEIKVACQVLSVDTAGRHELHLGVRSGHGFNHVQSASSLCREEFYNLKTKLDCNFHIARV